MEVISRGDSTLRGHIVAEVRPSTPSRRRVTGAGFDGVMLVPCFFEAGRFTAEISTGPRCPESSTPAGETEFAQDATFGYTSSNSAGLHC